MVLTCNEGSEVANVAELHEVFVSPPVVSLFQEGHDLDGVRDVAYLHQLVGTVDKLGLELG